MQSEEEMRKQAEQLERLRIDLGQEKDVVLGKGVYMLHTDPSAECSPAPPTMPIEFLRSSILCKG